ncbi:MAG: hypothetical protein LBT27_08600 [Prevotellaceae bacterium]|jgi:hypothetical protein|nr:hypothetical protein [Prevotellaceae bacterium]
MQTTGIKIERDNNGVARYVRIDLKKYGKYLTPLFKKVGINTNDFTYSQEFINKINQSEEDIKKGKVISFNSHEELMQHLDSL